MGKYTIIAVALAALLGMGFWWSGSNDSSTPTAANVPDRPGPAMVNVTVPETLSANAEIGKVAFEAKCAVCHGANAAGQDGVAPPLVHKIYEPSHHGDAAFLLAAKNGVRAHHWRFGNMPPVEGVTDGDVKMIIAYVRELQRANGIN
jgi:mono/diheme cytochrome c family protein